MHIFAANLAAIEEERIVRIYNPEKVQGNYEHLITNRTIVLLIFFF